MGQITSAYLLRDFISLCLSRRSVISRSTVQLNSVLEPNYGIISVEKQLIIWPDFMSIDTAKNMNEAASELHLKAHTRTRLSAIQALGLFTCQHNYYLTIVFDIFRCLFYSLRICKHAESIFRSFRYWSIPEALPR